MGNCLCQSSEENRAKERTSRQIDRTLAAEQRIEKAASKAEVKLLLLGAAETGKSTILKQIRLYYDQQYSREEVLAFRSQILENATKCIKDLINAMDDLKIPYDWDPLFPLSVQTLVEDDWPTDTAASLPHETRTTTTTTKPAEEPFKIIYEQQSIDSWNRSDIDSPSLFPRTLKQPRYSPNPSLQNHTLKRSLEDPLAEFASLQYYRVGGLDGQQGNAPYAAKFLSLINFKLDYGYGEKVPQIVLDAVKTIWEDKGVQYCHSRGSEFHLMDCCAYILDSLDRICDPEYLPSKQDILFAREETQKITESSFQLAKHVLRVYDMGGIRGQRRKWASFFENVHLIVNVVAVSAFDQFTVEDGVTNRVVDSLNIFGSICNHPLFKRTIFILFINKIDLFKIKLKSKRIAVYFRDFQGENSYENGCEYFIKLFLSVNKYKSKKIHVHLTQATDSQEMAKILKSVTMVILKANIKTSRLF